VGLLKTSAYDAGIVSLMRQLRDLLRGPDVRVDGLAVAARAQRLLVRSIAVVAASA
jgi:hypothetical protein